MKGSSLGFFILFLVFILGAVISSENKNENSTKNILMFTFPGGKSHVFIFLELLRTTFNKLKVERPNTKYKFHVLVHNYDINLWDELEGYEDYQLYGFGSVQDYDVKFIAAMDLAKEDPIFGYKKFNEAMIFLNGEFLNSGVLQKLKNMPFTFDLIITDVINLVAPFLKRELNIPKMMYVNPTCIYTWVMPNMEYNAAYAPVLGTTYSDNMSFFERLSNTVIKKGTEMMYNGFKTSQNKLFISKGYETIDPFQPNSLFLNQCVNGVHFPVSLPPNFIPAGAFLPRPPKILTDPKLNEFLNKYSNNIYVSQGTITKAMKVEQLIDIFKHYPNIGFVFSIRKDMKITTSLPENVLGMSWVRQNDLLGDKRIKGFVTHGGLNSILESIYHAKPMIVLGTSIDQVNSAALGKSRKYGISFTSDKSITPQKLIESIKEILDNPIYKNNISKASKIVQSNDGKQTFYYWLNYVLDIGYEHLIIPGVIHYSWYQIFNFDILFVAISILVIGIIVFLWIIKRIISKC